MKHHMQKGSDLLLNHYLTHFRTRNLGTITIEITADGAIGIDAIHDRGRYLIQIRYGKGNCKV